MQNKIQSKFQHFVARMLVRFKLIKKVPVDIEDVNQLISPQLPVSFEITIPGGDGELTILDVELSLDKNRDLISAQILCNFSVKVNRTIIYNTHLQLALDANLDYSKTSKTISPVDIKKKSLQLISDKYSVIKDTKTLITGFLPEPLKTVFATTLATTGLFLETMGISDMVKYLSLYLTGSKQRILNYHHLEIENKIISFAESGSLSYQLDESDFDEQLFAEYGEQVTIKNGQLLFIFHPGS